MKLNWFYLQVLTRSGENFVVANHMVEPKIRRTDRSPKHVIKPEQRTGSGCSFTISGRKSLFCKPILQERRRQRNNSAVVKKKKTKTIPQQSKVIFWSQFVCLLIYSPDLVMFRVANWSWVPLLGSQTKSTWTTIPSLKQCGTNAEKLSNWLCDTRRVSTMERSACTSTNPWRRYTRKNNPKFGRRHCYLALQPWQGSIRKWQWILFYRVMTKYWAQSG